MGSNKGKTDDNSFCQAWPITAAISRWTRELPERVRGTGQVGRTPTKAARRQSLSRLTFAGGASRAFAARPTKPRTAPCQQIKNMGNGRSTVNSEPCASSLSTNPPTAPTVHGGIYSSCSDFTSEFFPVTRPPPYAVSPKWIWELEDASTSTSFTN